MKFKTSNINKFLTFSFIFLITNKTSGIFRANFDGSNQTKFLTNFSFVDISVWPEVHQICFVSRNRTAVQCANFEGTGIETIVDLYEPLTNLAFGDGKLFYYHPALLSKSHRGAIVFCDPRLKCANEQQIVSFSADNETLLVDMILFNSKISETDENSCNKNNGDCQQLCFYLGSGKKKCDCAFGKLAADGTTCSPHDAFLVYSKVNRKIKIIFFGIERNFWF